ncbi:MAG: DUF4199 domain-containing protein [Saprospiraceae bacterium]
MQRTVLTFGFISGLIILTLAYISERLMMGENGEMNCSGGELLGYTTMIIALSMVFFGVRQIRERHLGGNITFGQAFKVGFLIALVASAMYVIGWMIYYNASDLAQTFPAQYIKHMKEQWAASGMTQEQITAKSIGLEKNFELYKNPLIMAGMTLMEILPVGLIISLLSALILKRKNNEAKLNPS